MGSCFKFAVLICCVGLIAGCGGDNKVKQGTPPTTAPSTSSASNTGNAAGSNASRAAQAPPAGNSYAARNAKRQLPTSSLGGGGGGGAGVGTVDPNNPAATTTTPPANNDAASTLGDGELSANSLPNGLFPQIAEAFVSDGFGGGLFPQGAADNAVASNTTSPAVGGNSRNGGRTLPTNSIGGGGSRPGAPNTGQTAGGGTITPTPSVDGNSTSNSLLDQAKQAFKERNEADAFKYLYAHVLTNDSAFDAYPISWYSGLADNAKDPGQPIGPRLALRWGVGVVYSAPKTYDERPPVIGAPADSSSASRRNSGGGGSGLSDDPPPISSRSNATESDYTNVDSSNPEGFILYYTGDYGNEFLDRLEERRNRTEGYYGAIIRDMDVRFDPVDAQAASGTTRPAAGGGSNTGTQRPGNRDLPTSAIGGGGGASNTRANPGGRNNNNNNAGNAAASSSAPDLTRVQRVSGSSESRFPDSQTLGTIAPGVMLVGEGSKSELLERAKNLGLDCLAIFQVRIAAGKKATCTTNLKVFNVHSRKEIASGRNLKTEDADKSEERGRDIVKAAVDEVFDEGADTQLKAVPLPAGLKPEHVSSRLARLMEESDLDPLAMAVEIVSFNRKGLLDDAASIAALDKILAPGVGQVLLSGSESDRFAALQPFLPDDGNSNVSFTPGTGSSPNSLVSTGGGNNKVSFTHDIAPILVANCGTCHVRQSKGKMSLASFDAVIKSDMVKANSPDLSRLVEVLVEGEMPPRGAKVAAADIQKIRDWIAQGASFDGSVATENISNYVSQ